MQGDRRPQRVWSAALAHTITKPAIALVMGFPDQEKPLLRRYWQRRSAANSKKAMIFTQPRTWRRCTAARRLRMQTGCLGYEKSPKKSMVGARVANPAC